MSAAKAVFGRLVGRFLFTASTVSSVSELAPRFRRIELAGPALRGVTWTPGDKVQLFLDGEMRTYTPTRWDAERGATAFVAYVHGDGPGAAWAGAVKAGDAVSFFGPRGSVQVQRAPVVLFGDETSFAVALALKAAALSVRSVFEVSDEGDSARALAALGVEGSLVRRDGEAHVPALLAGLLAALRENPGAQLVMTGRARTIQALKQKLSAEGFTATRSKAYWADGKRGID